MCLVSQNVLVSVKMKDVDRNSFDSLISFIHSEIPWSKKEKLKLNTDIVEDLGVWGDDCEEFFVKFCEKFNVECKKIDINRCGSEGIFFPCIGSLIYLLNLIGITQSYKKEYGYTLKELLELIEKSK